MASMQEALRRRSVASCRGCEYRRDEYRTAGRLRSSVAQSSPAHFFALNPSSTRRRIGLRFSRPIPEANSCPALRSPRQPPSNSERARNTRERMGGSPEGRTYQSAPFWPTAKARAANERTKRTLTACRETARSRGLCEFLNSSGGAPSVASCGKRRSRGWRASACGTRLA